MSPFFDGDRPNFSVDSLKHFEQVPYRSCGLAVLCQLAMMVSSEQPLQLLQRYSDYVSPVLNVMNDLHSLIFGI